MNDIAAISIKNTAQIIKCPPDIEIGNINMPMLVPPKWPLKTTALCGCSTVPFAQKSFSTQHPINAAGANRNHIGIKHHEGKTTISLIGMQQIKINDGLFLPVFKPEVSGNPGIMFIDSPITLLPVVKFTWGYSNPPEKLKNTDLRFEIPSSDKIYDCIPGIMGNPQRI